jgi:hypothetical protein
LLIRHVGLITRGSVTWVGAADFESPSPPSQRSALLIPCLSASFLDHLGRPGFRDHPFRRDFRRGFLCSSAALPNFDLGDQSSSCSRIRPSECQDENVMRIYFVKASEQ